MLIHIRTLPRVPIAPIPKNRACLLPHRLTRRDRFTRMLQHAGKKMAYCCLLAEKEPTSAVLASWLAHYRRVADTGSAAKFGIPQTKLSRDSNQIARGRIRQFESYMPSQAVQSLWGVSDAEMPDIPARRATLRPGHRDR
jgi:hypothetical protein